MAYQTGTKGAASREGRAGSQGILLSLSTLSLRLTKLELTVDHGIYTFAISATHLIPWQRATYLQLSAVARLQSAKRHCSLLAAAGCGFYLVALRQEGPSVFGDENAITLDDFRSTLSSRVRKLHPASHYCRSRCRLMCRLFLIRLQAMESGALSHRP